MARKRGDSVSTAAFKILQKINEYELISGETVSDLELSKEFNMSRTPVREAIVAFSYNSRLADNIILKTLDLHFII